MFLGITSALMVSWLFFQVCGNVRIDKVEAIMMC
jgi:hypothetical protein